MEAKVTKEFPGLPDGQTQVRAIKKGETISGDLARVAVREKWATEIKDKGVVQEPPAPKPLKDMSIDELKAYAVEKKIALGDATTPPEIIAAIELASEKA
jgi:hypothetical protein